VTSSRTGVDLHKIARQAMKDRGFEADFSPALLAELAAVHGAAPNDAPGIRDMRSMLWCSIDNDDSRDLDQLTVAEAAAGGIVKVYVAIADVDAIVKRGSALDAHAENNTTSVYTAVQIFPMLPERLSTDLTSLGEGVDRAAVVVEFQVAPDGSIAGSTIYRASVHNQAKLAYDSISAWLEGRGPLPERVARLGGLAAQVRLQDQVAQKMRALRHQHGALALEIIQPHVTTTANGVEELGEERRGRARELIEDFMIGANGVTARFLAARQIPALLRVVREPKRWDRIVELARGFGASLPPLPNAKALEEFLQVRRRIDPERFPDLSLSIVKLMGAGEYVVEMPGQTSVGHFGLAVLDYTHATAPNRRFPDLITQRLMKAALAATAAPYSPAELTRLAAHCTAQEDAANKVERRVMKSAAAQLFQSRVGEVFDALVTGAAAKGTWVRMTTAPVEGKLVRGSEGVDIGDHVRVRLTGVDVERGFIDFARV
jgi:VacB/RNase II family 3'-5' exoribonuclease